ncbi:dihydroorotase [Vallitalea okinawensis]|uniref:dihydroorotase n=1 Tax=Vallitalea okinawensis TaxID=2078660 RepID=UPI000CFAECFD|nr:amidohydrolase family protein [Vallitalea okinawensis]
MYDLGILNGKLYIEGHYIQKNLYIKDGKIQRISKEILESRESYDADGKKVFPGFIDPHVHFELGGGNFTSCDDFYSGSVSAAYGGITTFIDFLDPISKAGELKEAFHSRQQLAEKSIIDYAFHVTLKNPVNQVVAIVEAMKKMHLPTVKIFTTYSDSDRRTYDSEIRELLRLTQTHDFLVLAHIESDDLINLNAAYGVADLLTSRSTDAELKEALKLAGFTKELEGRLYMVHLSSGKTLKALLENYPDILNQNLYLESCPHYFTQTSDRFKENQGYLFTMAPPLRTVEEVNLLKDNFNYINTIGTDHCPFLKAEKKQEKLIGTPMGIGGVEHSFNIMYSLFGEKVVDKMTIEPAKIFGLYPKKGTLQRGADADIVIYDPTKKHVINEDHSSCDYSIYQGYEVCGDIESTISRGCFVVKDKELIGGRGQYVRDEV